MHKYPFVVLFFIIPFLFIGYKNKFKSELDTFVRFLTSIFISWGYLILYRLMIDSVDVSFLCCDDYGMKDAATATVMIWGASLLASLLAYGVIKGGLWFLKISWSERMLS